MSLPFGPLQAAGGSFGRGPCSSGSSRRNRPRAWFGPGQIYGEFQPTPRWSRGSGRFWDKPIAPAEVGRTNNLASAGTVCILGSWQCKEIFRG